MIASRGALREPKSLKNLSSTRKRVPESFSCGKTTSRASHSAVRRPFAREFSRDLAETKGSYEPHGFSENSLSTASVDDAGRFYRARTRRTRKTSDPGRSGFASAISQPGVETGR